MAKPKIAIIGGGIAGVILAWQANKGGYCIDLYDDNLPETPSKVAAGILNPLSVSRKKAIWNAEAFITENNLFYSQFSNKVVHNTSMLINVSNSKEQNSWSTSKASEDGFLQWEEGNKRFGIRGSAWIDTEKLIATLPLKNFTLYNQRADMDALSEQYDFVILATGKIDSKTLASNGLREDMFRVVLGDILQVKLNNEYPFMHLEGLFIIPKTNGSYTLGSTYIHQFNAVEKDPSRANLLVEKASRQGLEVQEIISHRVAVRPAIYDRMPVVGKLKKNIYCFAGMGSRGLFHAPLLAKNLLQYLEGETDLFNEVNIERAKAK